MNVKQALRYAQQNLHDISDNADYEAKRLLGHILDQDNTWLHINTDANLTQQQVADFQDAVAKRATGYPLAYILGKWGFYQWEFLVNKHVLIPRPETEMLVEQAAAWARTHYPAGKFVDVGTGSGIIAVSMGLLLPRASVLAVDVSSEALAVARLNAEQLEASNVRFRQSDLLSDVPRQNFDMILANLPYIDTEELHTLDVFDQEPTLALDGGPAGMVLIDRLLKQATDHVKPGSTIWLEIGIDQGLAVRQIVEGIWPEAEIEILQDLTKRDRVVKIIIQETQT